eukprot:13640-Pleurochrysis_carterae.AAC.2
MKSRASWSTDTELLWPRNHIAAFAAWGESTACVAVRNSQHVYLLPAVQPAAALPSTKLLPNAMAP